MRFVFVFLILSLFKLNAAPYETGIAPWGVDSDLLDRKTETTEQEKHNFGTRLCTKMLHFYQGYISPINGPRSSFYPTSSQYALEAIQKYGVLAGIALGCDRLMRENSETWVYERTDKYGMERKLDPVR